MAFPPGRDNLFKGVGFDLANDIGATRVTLERDELEPGGQLHDGKCALS